MKKTILILVGLLIFSFGLKPFDINSYQYFPLATGNKWVYDVYVFYPQPAHWIEVSRVLRDTSFNGKRYYLLNGCEALSGWFRVDSLNGNLLRYSGSNCPHHPLEDLNDSLSSRVCDTFYNCMVNSFGARVCKDTLLFTLSGINYSSKRFQNVYELSGTENRFAKNLGLVGAVRGDPWGYYYGLKGCVINGVVYGDTSTVVGIQGRSNSTPLQFTLYQNYPNPFNPSTSIKFDIPKETNVKLSIFDLLGREITTLVNEKLKPGTYQAKFDGTDYPSGAYFYKLETETFIQTKKMVLIK